MMPFRKIAAASKGKLLRAYFTENTPEPIHGLAITPGQLLDSGERLTAYYTGRDSRATWRPDMPLAAAQALGIAQGAYEAALEYAKVREQFEKPIIEFQAVGFTLADMATRIKAARLLTYEAAWRKDQHQDYVAAASMAKLFASETAMWVATKAIQVHGSNGYSKEYPVERFFRDAKITEIYEGTSEIQRLVIAREIGR